MPSFGDPYRRMRRELEDAGFTVLDANMGNQLQVDLEVGWWAWFDKEAGTVEHPRWRVGLYNDPDAEGWMIDLYPQARTSVRYIAPLLWALSPDGVDEENVEVDAEGRPGPGHPSVYDDPRRTYASGETFTVTTVQGDEVSIPVGEPVASPDDARDDLPGIGPDGERFRAAMDQVDGGRRVSLSGVALSDVHDTHRVSGQPLHAWNGDEYCWPQGQVTVHEQHAWESSMFDYFVRNLQACAACGAVRPGGWEDGLRVRLESDQGGQHWVVYSDPHDPDPPTTYNRDDALSSLRQAVNRYSGGSASVEFNTDPILRQTAAAPAPSPAAWTPGQVATLNDIVRSIDGLRRRREGPTHLVMRPSLVDSLRREGADPVTDGARGTLWGLPVIVSDAVPEGQAYVVRNGPIEPEHVGVNYLAQGAAADRMARESHPVFGDDPEQEYPEEGRPYGPNDPSFQ